MKDEGLDDASAQSDRVMGAAVRARPDVTAGSFHRTGGTDEIAALAKALGHPARIHIIRLLLAKRSCIGCDIVDEVGLAQSTVSEHLRILKAAGLIVGEIERPRVCYSLNPHSIAPLADFLNAILGADNRSQEARDGGGQGAEHTVR
jgi:ArsR family transcriptional regulator, arsenate/arsenite/antimonite-responsive transcriptional repressor